MLHSNQTITFLTLLTAVLHHLYSKEEADLIYLYYWTYADSLFKRDAELVQIQPLHAKLWAAINLVNFLIAQDGVEYFEALHNYPAPILKRLSLPDLLSQLDYIYLNHGLTKSNGRAPPSAIHLNMLPLQILQTIDFKNISGYRFPPSEIGMQLQIISQMIKGKNYQVTTVKALYKDIIKEVCPDMADRDQNYVWRMFKSSMDNDLINYEEE